MLSKIKKYLQIMAVSFIVILTAIVFFLNKKIKQLDKTVAEVTNNYRFYESQFSNTHKENRVLQLTIGELNTSKDSLIEEVVKAKKELKIKDKAIKQALVINTEMRDTTLVKILTKEVDFTEKLTLNSLTTITVSRKDSILTTILDLKNQLILFIEEKKEYRNKYKNGWQRFWHFDWKKDKLTKYLIKNTNELIKVTDTRIINMTEK